MEDNEVMENIEETTTIEDAYTELNEASDFGSKILMGGVALAAGVAGGLICKNKEKIKGAFADAKEKRRIKKVERTMAKLAKLEAKAPKPKKETEEE